MKTLSLCMITKNEESNIERCLKSIQNLVDEIIVADTGSTDRTVELAEKYGAKIVYHKWNNNFSDARNTSLEVATCDWILFLDADEEITEEECRKIKFLMDSDNAYEGYFLRLVNIIENKDVGDSIVLRMFKNKSEYRFRGKMHEQICNSIKEIHGTNSIGNTDIRILHYEYDSNVSDVQAKQKRNIELLKSYSEEEKDGYYYYALGNEYARVGDFENAYESYEKALKVTNVKYIHYPYLILAMAKLYFEIKKFGQEIKFIQSIKKTTPNFKGLYFMECIAYIECGKLSKALKSLENFSNCPASQRYEYPNNNFEKVDDIKSLREKIIGGMIPHEDNMLSALMIIDEYDETLVETITSINEITINVVVVADNETEIEVEKLKSTGAQVIQTKHKDKRFSIGLKSCKGKYVMLLEKGEICSFESQKEIVKLLSKTNLEAFNLLNLNMFTGDYTNNLKIIKNNKKVNSPEEYVEILKSQNKKVKDVPIYTSNKITNTF